MREQEVRELYEAYQQVHQPQELTEEVEIAAQYFYNLGLNDEGVQIFIEELGVEEFGEFVYDLAEEYTLTEASETRLQRSPLSLKGPKGSRPQSTTKARVKKQGGTEMRTSARPDSTVRVKKSGSSEKEERSEKASTAVETAKKSQPKKRPVLDAIARQVSKGMERHRAAMSAARETGKTIRKAADKIGGVAREVGKGASGAAKFAVALSKEELEIDLFDTILEYLVAEGYADTNEAALVIMANMSEDWRESLISEYFSIGGPSVGGGGGSRGPSKRQRRKQEQERRGHELRSRAKQVVDRQRRGSHGEADSQMSAQPDRKKDYDPNSGWAHYYDDSARGRATALRPRG